ncbi:hypothetical protein ACSYDW_07195 [Paeniglutamicibacter sp. R2-26]|uniref:hypothetical protein n=1 Tax=Paeniglutamicibacter sp. R2-26 TaxID=3144417 RepID=UPI003EE5F7F9
MSASTTMYESRPGPAHNRARPTYTHLAEHLQENPGEWFVVRTAPTHNAAASAAYQIKTGKRAAFRPADHYDAYATGTEVIARYTGGN